MYDTILNDGSGNGVGFETGKTKIFNSLFEADEAVSNSLKNIPGQYSMINRTLYEIEGRQVTYFKEN